MKSNTEEKKVMKTYVAKLEDCNVIITPDSITPGGKKCLVMTNTITGERKNEILKQAAREKIEKRIREEYEGSQ